MGRLHAGCDSLHAVVRRMDGQPVDAARPARHLRPLHFGLFLPFHLAPQRRDVPPKPHLQGLLRMDQCDRLRHGRGYARAYLPVPDVRDPFVLDGEVAAYRGLPLREQGGLRPPDAQHARFVPVRASHHAVFADPEIVLRNREMALPPAQGTGSRETQRRGGLQLPGGRHGAARHAGRYLLRRAAPIPTGFRPRGGPAAPVRGTRGRYAAGGQTRKLHQTLRGPAGRHAPDRIG